MPRFPLACLALLLLLAPACATPAPAPPPAPPAGTLAPARAPLAMLDDGDRDSLREALRHSITYLQGLPGDSLIDYGVRRVSAERAATALEELDRFLDSDPDAARLAAWLDERFDRAEAPAGGQAMVTGYFVPVIAGARQPGPTANVPVYGRPADLVTAHLPTLRSGLPDERVAGRVVDGQLVPYFTRREIQDEGALRDHGAEIAWAEDRIDLFFLEVQGSGYLRLPDGEEMAIGYAATNGHPYRSIGRLLIEEGRIPEEEMSMQALRAYLAANPHDASRVLNHNPSLVFFRELDTPPLGSLGVPVTAGRSIATDYRLFPAGALAFLETTHPRVDEAGRHGAGAPLRRLVLNQDTGGAIRGPHRVDFFWGRGPEAGQQAGLMQQDGRLVFLVPR